MLWTINIAAQSISDYNIVWDKPSNNSSESMPCGGGDIGMNVWVESGDLLLYFSRSGTFDENNTLLKLGRIRIKLTPNPFEGETFRQELKLEEGCVTLKAANKGLSTDIRIWADVFNPLINIDINNNQHIKAEVFYENWRYQDRLLRKNESNQNSYKWAAPKDLVTQKDNISFVNSKIIFYHQNDDTTIFDATVRQQGLDSVRQKIYNPLDKLIFGGSIYAKGLKYGGISAGIYNNTDYKAWKLETEKPQKNIALRIQLHTAQSTDMAEWQQGLNKKIVSDAKENITWWKNFWNRSYINIQPDKKTGKWFEVARNYQLFRYMLACNAYGEYPTKFNGGLFTYDPAHTDSSLQFTPDFRKWGGGTHTAQNQRLVYFPMLKSGDVDMMKSQFDFYKRILPTAELRSKVYWNHGGACFTEQIENFGLPNPSEYGWKRPEDYDKGMEYNAWLEYQWDTALEFCYMILESRQYAEADIKEYLPLVESTLRFFDEHYQYLARQRGRKVFDEQGKLVLYPGSACETYKMAYNATSTIAALKTVTEELLKQPKIAADSAKQIYFETFLSKLPEIKKREIDGHTTIAPAWLWERVNNVETPQLYPVFPWQIYGVNKPDLDIAINTWKYDKDVIKFRSHVGWKQDAIWAARLGLKEEAKELVIKKLENANTRFPTFWGPGYDWTPDHNWGGSGMIALQEMLMQVDGDKILLFPCWDKTIDVHFKLHAPNNTTVECKLTNGNIEYINTTPRIREKDIIIIN